MRKKILCAFHDSCADGFGAAAAIMHSRALDDCSVEYIPVKYGRQNKDFWDAVKTGSFTQVLVLDFSFSLEEMLSIAEYGHTVVWIDHHLSAEPMVATLEKDPRFDVLFNKDHSGAYLTWFKYNMGEVPSMISHIQHWDLWHVAEKMSFQIVEALRIELSNYQRGEGEKFQEPSSLVGALLGFIQESETAPYALEALNAKGRSLLNAVQIYAEGQAAKSFKLLVGESVIDAAFSTTAINEISEELNNRADAVNGCCVIVPQFKEGRACYQLSFRSKPNLPSVLDLALMLGGGGHRNACAATIEHAQLVPQPFGFSVAIQK